MAFPHCGAACNKEAANASSCTTTWLILCCNMARCCKQQQLFRRCRVDRSSAVEHLGRSRERPSGLRRVERSGHLLRPPDGHLSHCLRGHPARPTAGRRRGHPRRSEPEPEHGRRSIRRREGFGRPSLHSFCRRHLERVQRNYGMTELLGVPTLTSRCSATTTRSL